MKNYSLISLHFETISSCCATFESLSCAISQFGINKVLSYLEALTQKKQVCLFFAFVSLFFFYTQQNLKPLWPVSFGFSSLGFYQSSVFCFGPFIIVFCYLPVLCIRRMAVGNTCRIFTPICLSIDLLKQETSVVNSAVCQHNLC